LINDPHNVSLLLHSSSCALKNQNYNFATNTADKTIRAAREMLAKAFFVKVQALEGIGQTSNFPPRY
jgi:hypothetical protein